MTSKTVYTVRMVEPVMASETIHAYSPESVRFTLFRYSTPARMRQG